MKKNILAFLFGDSQVESEIDETRDAIEQIFEEAEDAEPLKAKKTPLAAALKALGVSAEDGLELDPEGFSICYCEEEPYREACQLLTEPEGMEKLAELGWFATRMGDKAMTGEMQPEYRIRFIDITTPEPENKTDWPAPNNDLMTSILKKGRELATTPFERDPNNPVTDIDAKDDKHAGMGKEKDGSDPEGKPKGGTKSEARNLVDHLLGPVNEGGHKAGCTCGFCKNKGKGFKKKGDAEDKGSEPAEKEEPADKPKSDSDTVEKTFESDEPPGFEDMGEAKRQPKQGKMPRKAFKTRKH